jgi:hypothetical protein
MQRKFPTEKEEIRFLVQGETDVIFRWYTRPEDSEADAERVPVCGVEGANCQEQPSLAGLLGKTYISLLVSVKHHYSWTLDILFVCDDVGRRVGTGIGTFFWFSRCRYTVLMPSILDPHDSIGDLNPA